LAIIERGAPNLMASQLEVPEALQAIRKAVMEKGRKKA
jgi:hypothetical protein